jgi:hypothetical protein
MPFMLSSKKVLIFGNYFTTLVFFSTFPDFTHGSLRPKGAIFLSKVILVGVGFSML